MALLELVAWMLPFVGFALAALYVGYLAYQADQARQQAARAPAADAGPDPVEELERVNTELARSITIARQTLDGARDAVQRGTR